MKHREVDFIIMQYSIFLSDTSFKKKIVCELDTCFFATNELYLKYKDTTDNNVYPLILPFNGYADIDTLEERLKRNNIKFSVKFRSYAFETVRELVNENLGIGWGLKKIIEKN